MKRIGGLVSTQSFNPNFPIDLVAKDFGFMIETAKSLNSQSPISSATKTPFEAAKNDFGNLDIAGIYQMFGSFND